MAKAPDPKQVAKDTAEQAARRRAELAGKYEIKVHVDDAVFVFRYDDVASGHVRQLREATGSTLFNPVLNTLLYFDEDAKVVALDKTAELVFLARLQAGETASLADVEGSITARNVIWYEFPSGGPGTPPEVEFLDPPASDGG